MRKHAPYKKPKKTPLTFAELQVRMDATPAQFIATLKDYALGCWAVSAPVVRAIRARMQLPKWHRSRANTLYRRGATVQLKHGYDREARIYESLLTA